MTRIKSFLDRHFPKGGLRRSASILAGGTIIAQVIAFALSPVLTRIYRVEDFGYLQVFTSILTVLSAIAAGRYEMAILLPEDDDTAVNLLAVAIFTVVATSSVLMGVVLIFAKHPWVLAHARGLSPYLWLLPFCLAGGGFYQALSYWSLRRKKFASVARTKVLQVASRFTIQLAAGLLKFGLPGLLVGETIARANGTGSFVREFYRDSRHLTPAVNSSGMWTAAKRYKNFPLVLGLSGLLNSVAPAIPSLLLATFFGPTVTGWFALVDRVLAAPSVLIGQSLQQVYASEGAPLALSDPTSLKLLFEKMIKKIYFIPIITCCTLTAFGPSIFAFVFGPQWREAGEYARILSFMDLIAFVAGPIDATLTMLERQSWRFGWDAGRLVLVAGAMLAAHKWGSGPKIVIAAYTASMMVGYFALLLMSYTAIKKSIRAKNGLDIDL